MRGVGRYHPSVPRLVAFLRGINVGGHRVKMERLRDLLSELGLKDVDAFLASGNLVFGSDEGSGAKSSKPGDIARLEARIGRHLELSLGYQVETFLRDPGQLEQVVRFAARSLAAESKRAGEAAPGDVRAHVLFLHSPPSPAARRALTKLQSADDRFLVRGTEVVWLRRGRFSDSQVAVADLDRALDNQPFTARTATTVERVLARA